MSVSEGRPAEGRAVASGVTAEAGAMVPTSDRELTSEFRKGSTFQDDVN